MRRAMIIGLVAVIAGAICITAFGDKERHEEWRPRRGMWSQGRGHRGWGPDRGPCACPIHMAARSLSAIKLVAGDDGEVIVMAGRKLMKYDEDLELVKEVDVNIDIEAMCSQIEKIIEDCPKRREMIEKRKEMMKEQKEMMEGKKEEK